MPYIIREGSANTQGSPQLLLKINREEKFIDCAGFDATVLYECIRNTSNVD